MTFRATGGVLLTSEASGMDPVSLLFRLRLVFLKWTIVPRVDLPLRRVSVENCQHYEAGADQSKRDHFCRRRFVGSANRGIVIQTLFDLGPTSRAELARRAGVNRTTISGIVPASDRRQCPR